MPSARDISPSASMSRRVTSSASWPPRSTRWPRIWPSSGARTSARSSGPRTRSRRRWKRCRTRWCCSMPAGQIQSMNRAAVSALASAGDHEPRRLDDLRLDGLDLDAVTRAIATGSGAVSASRPDAHDPRRTGRRGPAAAAARRARSGARTRKQVAPCSCCTTSPTWFDSTKCGRSWWPSRPTSCRRR